MEDCCAVCAEPLEWIAYGQCGHQDVCSKCIARLRFVLGDRQCCICKQECPSVFVTKALGDYTKSIENFGPLAERRDLWYESNIQAYCDDEEQYNMLKAMFRLSCAICEQAENLGKDFVKRGFVFRNLDLMHRHLSNVHKVQMCGLCLEGRKVFIREQKLYMKKQLDRHLVTGDLEIDGGGFNGHPLCSFCRTRFYGDNELYHHMSTDHFTCHICQRLHPGQFEYYRNYDDLEAHFRHGHALCEHPDCLAQKFVVFISDTELKRHNALVHGGNMSRSQRNAALQIPVSFQYRSQTQRGGRVSRQRDGHITVGRQGLQTTIMPSLEQSIQEPSLSLQVNNTVDFPHIQSNERNFISSSGDANEGEEASAVMPVETSRYRAAVSRSGPSSSFIESAFPPLPGSENAGQRASARTPYSMASLIRGRGRTRGHHINSMSTTHAGETARNQASQSSEILDEWPQVLGRSQSNVRVVRESTTSRQSRVESLEAREVASTFTNEIDEPSSIPLSMEELRVANKAMIERIRTDLHGDEDQFNEFKIMSSRFRSGDMDADLYLHYIRGFGLLHIVPELARLCPDAQKKSDLLHALERIKVNDNHLEKSRLLNATQRVKDNNHVAKKDLELLQRAKDRNEMEYDLSDSFPGLMENVSKGENSQNGNQKNGKKKLMAESSNQRMKQRVNDEMGSLQLNSDGRYGNFREEQEMEVLSKDGYRDQRPAGTSSISNDSFGRNGMNIRLNKGAKVLVKASKSSARLEGSSLKEEQEKEKILQEPSISSSSRDEGSSSSTWKEVQESDKLTEKKKKKPVKIRLGDGSVALHLDAKRRTWGGE